jgi:hypothetical protein
LANLLLAQNTDKKFDDLSTVPALVNALPEGPQRTNYDYHSNDERSHGSPPLGVFSFYATMVISGVRTMTRFAPCPILTVVLFDVRVW